jgi:hypothetical protein
MDPRSPAGLRHLAEQLGQYGENSPHRAAAEREALLAIARHLGILVAFLLEDRLQDTGGAEHYVWFDEKKGMPLWPGRSWPVGRVVKSTLGDEFGLDCHARAVYLPSTYFMRLHLQNEVFGDSICWEGVVLKGHHLHIITSQPFVRGEPPTDEEIAHFFLSNGFESVNLPGFQANQESSGSWLALPGSGFSGETSLAAGLHPVCRRSCGKSGSWA